MSPVHYFKIYTQLLSHTGYRTFREVHILLEPVLSNSVFLLKVDSLDETEHCDRVLQNNNHCFNVPQEI